MIKQVQSKFLIYGLCDPDTGEVRYIGKSSSGLHRPRSSMKPSVFRRETGTHKTNWLELLHRQGKKPSIVILDMSETHEPLFEMEKTAIAKFRADGARLVNATDGGEGAPGFKQSPESIQKRVAKNTGQKRSEETRRRLSESRLGMKMRIQDLDQYKMVRSESQNYRKKHFMELHSMKLYRSLTEAARDLGLNRGNISAVLNGRSTHTKGFRFEYVGVQC